MAPASVVDVASSTSLFTWSGPLLPHADDIDLYGQRRGLISNALRERGTRGRSRQRIVLRFCGQRQPCLLGLREFLHDPVAGAGQLRELLVAGALGGHGPVQLVTEVLELGDALLGRAQLAPPLLAPVMFSGGL